MLVGVVGRRAQQRGRGLAHQPVRRLVQVVGHLHGQHAARRQRRQQARQQPLVVAHPLQRGIGIGQVHRLGRRPFGDVALLEAQLRQALAGRGQHGLRAVGADDARHWEARDQQLGGIARAAAQVDHVPRRVQRHARQQLGRRAGAFVLEAGVQRGVPVAHRASSAKRSTWPSAWRAKRCRSAPCTGASSGQGQPPKAVRR